MLFYNRLIPTLLSTFISRQLTTRIVFQNRTISSSKFLLNYFSNDQLLKPRTITNSTQRYYAKTKDKKANKGKKKVEINLTQLGEIIDVVSFEMQMKKCIDKLKSEYLKNVSLRSTTGAIETLNVKLDGKDYTLQELAQVVRSNPKTIVVNMAVFPQAIPAVLQTIQKSGMNLNPQQDGTTLYIPIPKVTKEHREGLAKNAKGLFVKCKDSIRDVQNKVLRDIKKQDNISKDLMFNVQDQINALADNCVKEAEHVFTTKQTELLGKE